MKYVYFVSHIYCEGYLTKWANCESYYDKAISDIDDIKTIADNIAKCNGYKQSPTILSFKLLRIEQE